MTIPDPLNPLLVQCVRCNVDCEDIQLDPQRGLIPRGFCCGSGAITDKDLMVIFPEPAGADSSEHWRYRRAKRHGEWDRVAAEANQVATEYFTNGRSNFHRRTITLLVDVFRSREEVFRRCYFTELTKCEKHPSRENLSIRRRTRNECFRRYLERELRLVQPEAALLFGAVKDYQTRIEAILGAPGRTVAAHHPSRSPLWWRDTTEGWQDWERITVELRRLLHLAYEEQRS